ncbi:aromatic ring-opening dioxygenase LigA [Cellulomonas xiejunii]|uniref:Aromatic ring-opening dioxygenase LigA n=1 Tax=Cellulomonas xiejunii TaxID=2968083 RepID=A0ABY5KJJ8_9CELL|nr:aromatic ring-opening dioxygenase LigA [Cellulomonas xiejunii]MCC2312779.1 aromatic ring-opening dioxygenase LigA [Cellulomonas xiejunii]MCC2320351.1 aromatic ring-opening dioxygenase LigA [Cellulomonas xiejunii]UUI70651.1 aromatic ring-opening dioxygenase LigA [Cellulomonas xiejunii]
MSADVAPNATPVSTPSSTPPARRAHLLGTLLTALGILMALAGVGTWAGIAQGLAQEEITVSEDAAAFAGQPVVTPWAAWAQTEVIRADLAEMTGGLTYAEMDREDPQRPAVATGTFLRASLITSVIAFGVALALVGIGTGFVLGGLGLRNAAT